ncbi:MAG: three-Cys-motif partner protein TcmP [Melioribacteraceae bacterium]|nr:three-Cys-motif partner protein TcmP [Melioribacteraceae bacterium]
MKENSFFQNQSDLTSAKTKIYKNYIEGYLPKLLLTFGTCLIVDLFCGAGKNGEEDGSPLILLDRLKSILSLQQLQEKKNIKIHIVLNDQDKENIENLKRELEKLNYDKAVIKVHIKNKKYEELLPELIKTHTNSNLPKFFFLDSFTYSNVKMEHLKEIMSLSLTEVLLFIPIFHSYRFANKEFDENHKTRIFIEEFTASGIKDYGNVNNYLFSVRKKLLEEIKLKYVRPVLIDGGATKNALILLTKHQKGMLLMNKVAFSLTKDGSVIKANEQDQVSLFKADEESKFSLNFKELLIDYLRNNTKTNKEIVDFTIQKCFLPKHCRKEIKELFDLKKINVFDINNNEITDSNKWNIAENITKNILIKWKKNEKK